MSQTSTRVLLFALFIILSYFIWEKENVSVVPSIRKSRWREQSKVELKHPHVGKLNSMTLQKTTLFQTSSPLEWLTFDKKINSYYFTFYNWYHFELQFVDLGYDSYFQFKTFTEDHLHDRWTERVGFSLDDSFYPKGGRIRLPRKEGSNCSGCCGGCDKGLNLDISSNIFNMTVRQYTVKNQSGSRHDGYKYSRFWYYTPNKSLDDSSNEPFKSDVTVTVFNISYKGEDRNIEANLTHVLRHNHCVSYLDEQNEGTFRHNCHGGYGNGRIFVDRKIPHKNLNSYGKWVKSAFNLDNNRTRTAFLGVRSTKSLVQRVGDLVMPRTNWHWKGFKAFMQCFSKPEYYSKHENIQKERYIGLNFGRSFAPSEVENFQDFIFFNGKTHPIYAIDYAFSEKYQINKNITFRGALIKDKWQPEFEVNFTILSKQEHYESQLLTEHNQLRAYGFWSGYVDEGKKGERVEFFNISGYIETTNSIY